MAHMAQDEEETEGDAQGEINVGRQSLKNVNWSLNNVFPQPKCVKPSAASLFSFQEEGEGDGGEGDKVQVSEVEEGRVRGRERKWLLTDEQQQAACESASDKLLAIALNIIFNNLQENSDQNLPLNISIIRPCCCGCKDRLLL